MAPLMRVLRLSRFPIFHQLLLEEALLRTTKSSWCIVNDGAFAPAIVMGISGRANELIDLQKLDGTGVQVMKRFTGGGTVVVDEDTIFATVIMQGSDAPTVQPFPAHIMSWSENFYMKVFEALGEFSLRENDYVFGQRKFGGNAQAITGNRWLHHTSFLWDYQPTHMQLLKHPLRVPEYRQGRSHLEFITRLKDIAGDRSRLVAGLAAAPAFAGFDVEEVSLADASTALARNKQIGTKLVDVQALLQRT